MNIDSISFTSACKVSQSSLKKLTVPLKYGKKMKLTANENYLETVIIKGDNVLERSGVYISKGVPSKRLWYNFEQIQKNVKEGFDFFGEFCSTILKAD